MARKILVVEDHDGLAGAYVRVLQQTLDAEVTRAATQDEALAHLAGHVPSLIVTDIGHLGGTGVDLVVHIRHQPRLRAVPVIVISEQLFQPQNRQLFEYRLDGAFEKPIAPSMFIRAVARCLGEANADALADQALLKAGAEGMTLDYKVRIDLGEKKERAALAKDVLAFANSGGGSIVVGVDEPRPGSFVPVGLTSSEAEMLEVTRLNDALRRYIGTELSVGSRRFRHELAEFVVITVPAFRGGIALARDEHQEVGLFQGRIYRRNEAGQSTEVRDSTTLGALVDELVRDRMTRK